MGWRVEGRETGGSMVRIGLLYSGGWRERCSPGPLERRRCCCCLRPRRPIGAAILLEANILIDDREEVLGNVFLGCLEKE